ncbi:MAG: prepilin-type N-terminal cleavage/methylation domain-containing protein [Terriglobales bacterium]
MTPTFRSREFGFSFLELMVSLALGMLVIGAAVKLFSQGVDATWVISQRAEMQQDLRAAENLMLKDISLAGAGLTGVSGESVALPSGNGNPIYGCDQSGTAAGCLPNGGVTYPCIPVGACSPTLYPIISGYQLGITPPGAVIPVGTDLITVSYTDTTLPLSCYTATFLLPGNVITFTSPAVPLPSTCVLPPGIAYPQAVNDPVVGLTPGDILLVSTPLGFAAAEVTNVAGPNGAPAPGTAYNVTFADADALNLNQNGQPNDLTQVSGFLAGVGASVVGSTADRLLVITYYLQNIPDPSGQTTGTTILYRQVSGHTAAPVADNIVNLQFTYDTYDSSGNLLSQLGDPTSGNTVAPNVIRKINIAHLTIHSQLGGARSSLMATQGYQAYDVQTSMSARNLSYNNRYALH